MKPFQERVVEEKKQLDEKVNKLTTFLRAPAINCKIELERLQRQLIVMQEYSGILGERIENFGD